MNPVANRITQALVEAPPSGPIPVRGFVLKVVEVAGHKIVIHAVEERDFRRRDVPANTFQLRMVSVRGSSAGDSIIVAQGVPSSALQPKSGSGNPIPVPYDARNSIDDDRAAVAAALKYFKESVEESGGVALTVGQLTQALGQFDPSQQVYFGHPSHDYWKTELASPVLGVSTARVKHSDYQNQMMVVGDNDEGDGDGEEGGGEGTEVVLLKKYRA